MSTQILSTLPSNVMQRQNVFVLLKLLMWIGGWLLLIEVSLYMMVPYALPYNKPNELQRYLEYGRSVEGKIRRMIGKTDETSTPVTRSGWLLGRKDDDSKPTEVSMPGQILIAIYGMSYAQHVSEKLVHFSQIKVRFLGGPDAPPNHSYALYQFDRGKHKAKVIIWGILASSVVGMTTMTNLNKSFEHPLPYTYPKYRVVNSRLRAQFPPIMSMADFRATLFDQDKWTKYIDYLQSEDGYYHPLRFHESFLDNLAMVRFFRRSLVKRFNKKVVAKVYQADIGFLKDSVEIQALRMMITEFAQQVRQDDQLPILMLFSNQGYDDHLYQVLRDVIIENNIPTMRSHLIAPAKDPKNFLDDGHFTASVNLNIAKAVSDIIAKQLGRVVN